eukprot:5748464-Pleurochrysis_carterae.AAC.1
MKQWANIVTRKEGGKEFIGRRAHGLLKSFRLAINQRRFDPELANLTAAEAEVKLLLQWNGVAINTGAAQPVCSEADGPSQEATAQIAAALEPALPCLRLAPVLLAAWFLKYLTSTAAQGRAQSETVVRTSSAVGELARVRGLDESVGGSGVVAMSGCVGHARCGTPQLEKRCASAPQVRMRRECKMRNCACGPTGQGAASVSKRVLTTMAKRKILGLEANRENNRAR